MPREENGERGPLAREHEPVCPAVGAGREDLNARPEGLDAELAVEAGGAIDAADGVAGDGFASPCPMAGEANRRKLKQTYRTRRADSFPEKVDAAYREAEARAAERAAREAGPRRSEREPV